MNYSAKSGAAGKDLGQKGKNFAKIASSAGAKYRSVAAGERVAGFVLAGLRSHTHHKHISVKSKLPHHT